MILDILKKLVPASIRENEEQLMRSYVLLGIMLVNSTICFLGLVVFIFIIVLPPDIAWVGFSFVIGGLTGYAAIFWLFFITRSYFLASNAVIFMLIAMVYVAIAVTGGFEKSVMVQLCCLSPALAFLLTGLRAGTVWLSITCVLSGLSLFGSRVGIGYISLLPDEYGELMGVGLHFVLFFMIGGAIYLYEIIRNFP